MKQKIAFRFFFFRRHLHTMIVSYKKLQQFERETLSHYDNSRKNAKSQGLFGKRNIWSI